MHDNRERIPSQTFHTTLYKNLPSLFREEVYPLVYPIFRVWQNKETLMHDLLHRSTDVTRLSWNFLGIFHKKTWQIWTWIKETRISDETYLQKSMACYATGNETIHDYLKNLPICSNRMCSLFSGCIRISLHTHSTSHHRFPLHFHLQFKKKDEKKKIMKLIFRNFRVQRSLFLSWEKGQQLWPCRGGSTDDQVSWY